MADTNEPFLARWSRLKQAAPAAPAQQADTAPAPSVPTPSATPSASASAPGGEAAPAVDPADLPDVESLTRDSDFSVFLGADVPEHLQRKALRKLWASDPIFSHHDGLTDYADDYRNLPVMGDAVKTAWKVGRGFLDDLAEGGDAADAAATGPAPTDPAPTDPAPTQPAPTEPAPTDPAADAEQSRQE